MSEGTQSIGDEHAVVGEPASHPHQAVVVGEPPEDVAPVLGEPAFANGLQDQQPISPSSVDRTSANGFQSTPHTPFHEESSVSSSHVSAPFSASPVEESPNLQQAEAIDSGIGESATHQLEAPVAENPGPYVDEVLSASTDAETLVTPNDHEEVHHVEEEPAADIPDVVEITHIEDSPSEVPRSLSEVPTENPYAALDEGQTDENAPGEIISGDGGAPAANASSTPDEISSKGLGDEQEEASLSRDVQEKQSMEHLASAQTDADDGPLEGSKAVNEGVHAVELEQVGEGDVLAQESDAKEASLVEEETGSSVVEHPLAPELDQASERDAVVQGNDRSEDIPAETEAVSSEDIPVASEAASMEVEHVMSREAPQSEDKEVEHVMSKEAPQSEDSTTESSTPTPQKDILNENHAVPDASELQSDEETFVEAPMVDFSVAPQGTRAIVVEECVVNQPPTEETYSPPAENGSNGYQHCDNGEHASEREQDLPKDDVDASAEVEKPSSRSKLPLIFTGLAIAAVGVAVASISRPH